MRPRYSCEAIVLARTPLAEASASLALLTQEFGLVRARAQGIRKSGAKLATALTTLAECDTILVRGKEGWRLSGATLATNWCATLSASERLRSGRLASLMLRLMHAESSDHAPFFIFKGFLEALPGLLDADADAAECLAALRILQCLGLDAGEIPGEMREYDAATLEAAKVQRDVLVRRINHGIEASGL